MISTRIVTSNSTIITSTSILNSSTTTKLSGVTTTSPPKWNFVDPVYSCFKPYFSNSYSKNIIFLVGSYTPDQCFQYCNQSYTCVAFQISRTGSGVCGIFEYPIELNYLIITATTSVYSFSPSCSKPILINDCEKAQWFNSTYRCTSGLISAPNITTEDDCKAYCACALTDCQAAVVRNVSASSVECFIIKENSDLSNYQMCSISVRQFIVENNETKEMIGDDNDPNNNNPYFRNTLPPIKFEMNCWDPPNVPHSIVNLHKDQFGMAAIYNCKTGYRFPSGEKTRSLICNRYSWGGLTPICQPITCNFPPKKIKYGENIIRNCDEYKQNFRNHGNSYNFRFYDDHDFDYNNKDLNYFNNYDIYYTINNINTNNFNNNNNNNNNNKYFKLGNKTEIVKCVGSGSGFRSHFIPKPSRCIYTCKAPIIIHNTTLTFLPDLEISMYKCIRGHRFSDGKVKKNITCFHNNGSWPIIEACSVLFCGAFPQDPRLLITTKNLIFGSIVTISCQKGFMFPQYKTRKVLECIEDWNGDFLQAKWNDTINSCADVFCINPSNHSTSNSTNSDSTLFSSRQYSYMTTINYVCLDSRQKFSDGSKERNLICEENGKWNFEDVDCDSNRCDPIPKINNSTTNQIKAIKNSNVTYFCNEGYWFKNQVTSQYIICDGINWSSLSYTECKEIKCKVESENGKVNSSEVEMSYGNLLKLSCQPGYEIINKNGVLSNDIIINCTKHGNWSVKPACKPVNCGSPPLINLAVIATDVVHTLYQSQIEYRCLSSYWFGRDGYRFIAQCAESAEWKVDNEVNRKLWRKCQEIKCLPLFNYKLSNNQTTNKVGSLVNVSCYDDQKFENVLEISIETICNSRGAWMPGIPDCVEKIKQKIVLEIFEAPNSDVIATVAILILALQAVLLFIIEIPIWKKSFEFLKTNLKKNIFK